MAIFRFNRIVILSLVLVTITGVATYKIKTDVMDLEQQLHRIKAEINNEQDRITVLDADWSYLTRPARIQQLSKEMLAFAPIEPQRILTLDMLGDNAATGAPDTGKGGGQKARLSLYKIEKIEGAE